MSDNALAALEKRVGELETRGKDSWDKAKVLIEGLIPIMLALLSAVVARQGHENRKTIDKAQIKLADAQAELARNNTSVEKGKLVNSFIDSLLDSKTRMLAVEGVLLGLPGHEAERVIGTIPFMDTSATTLVTERLKPSFPVYVNADMQLACSHRGGSTGCIPATGLLRTPPPNGGLGVLQVSVPPGAKKVVGTLTEYSGSSCNGGAARAFLLADGQEIGHYDQGSTQSQPFDPSLPEGTRMLEFRVDALGEPFCDDTEWRDVRFEE